MHGTRTPRHRLSTGALGALLATAAMLLLPRAAVAATTTLYPTTNAVTGTVGTPTNAYANDGAVATVSSGTATLTLAGFPSTDLGTITDVTVWVKYKTSKAPTDDTYKFDAAPDGATFSQSILAASTANQTALVTASKSLGALTWAQVGTLAVRCTTARVGGADTYTTDVDVAYAVVTYTPATLPGTPGTLSFPTVNETSLTVSWGAATGATSYKVERAPDASGVPGTWAQIGTSATTSYADSGLTGSTKYWYRVRGTNGAGDGAYSAQASVTTTAPASPPGTPGTPAFASVAGTTLTVNWTAATGATSYKVERAPDASGAPGAWAQIGTSATTSYGDTGLTAGTTYWYRVRGTNTSGDGPYSAQASTTTLTVPVAPGTPTFATVTTSTLTVSWSAASGATSYKLERAPDAAGAPGAWAQIAAPATASYPDSGLSAGTTYWYRVRGTSAAGDGAYSSAASVVTVPPAPGALAFSNVTQTTLTVSWGSATGAASYKVERSPNGSTSWVQIGTSATTSYADSGLTANTPYWYRVRATNAAGDGAYDTAASVTTLANVPAAPGTPTYASVTQTSVAVSWTAASGATSYKLERGPSSGGPWTQVAAPATTSYADSPLAVNTTYWYQVRGTNAAGDGPYSAASSVTTQPGTTALADGTNPSAASVCPGAAATPVDAFALSATGAADPVTSVTVALAPSTAYLNLSSVEVTNDAGTTTYGSGVPANGSVTVGLTPSITATLGTATQYKLRLVPKTHAAMPAPGLGDAVYATTARVTGIAGTNPNPTLGDATSATVTVDNRSPANPKWGTVTVVGTGVQLAWTAPADADVARILILRNTASIQDVPVEGTTTYATGGTLGSSAIRYAGTTTPGAAGSASDAGPLSGMFFYKAFAQDACGNWSPVGVEIGPVAVGTGGIAEGDPTTNTTKPTLSIINPDKGTAVVGTFKVQVRVFYPNGATINATDLTLSTNGGSTFGTYAFTRNPNYGTANDRGVFETTVGNLTVGQTYTLRVRSSAGGGVFSNAVGVRFNTTTSGGGELLSRDNSSQLCTDCHALLPHSSETSGGKYGAWATTCRDCHTAHSTTNVYLVRNPITPPAVNGYQGPKEVRFSKQTGYSSTGGASNPAQASYANGDGTGPCQACHTRTKSPDGNPRYQAVAGAGDNHYSDEKCTKCHGHQTGFDGDQAGQCKTCHLKPQVDTDSYAWDGTPAIINETEWNAYGHGATANYPSGNGPARFSAQGNTVGDVGCLYCHTSSGRHGDLKNYFRLANTTTAFGPNGTCLVCHDKKTGTTYDPDGAGTNYAPLGSAVRVPAGHDGHPSVDDTGGTFCWDCHDPHGDAGATSWYMLQAQLVQSSIAAGPSAPATYADNWGLPNAAAGAKEFATITGFSAGLGGDTGKIDYPDYYIGGLCRNCHDTENVTAGTGTKFYSKTANVGYGTASTNHPVSPTDDTVRSRCTDCHIHKIGCGGCHNAPPPSGVHSSHNQIPAADQLDIDYRKLAPETTEALYGIRCAKCHNGTHSNQVSDSTRGTSTNPYTAELMWDSTVDPKTNGATYAPAGTQAPGSPYLGGESNPTKYWGWSEGTCRSEYCHSNGTPADSAVAYKDPVWKTGGGQPAWNCVSCHGDAAATATMSKAHALHAGTAAYAYGCEKCHLSVASSATALNTTYTGGGKKLHVNGLKDVKFDAYNGNTAGTYDGTGKTCSNTYCHSNGTDRTTADGTASGPSVAWTSTGTSTCTYCHGGDATTGTNVIAGAAKGGTAAHGKHVNNATLIGVNVGCASCHSATVSSNTTISGRANHVNADPNVSLASITRPSGGTARSNGTPTGTSPATTCASAWCHSSGQETPSYASVAWNATWTAPICNKCHGRTSSLAGEPDYATGGTNYNSHTAKHIPAASAAAACVRCHATTVTTAGTAILTTTPSMHLNGDRDVSFANVGSNAGGGATPYTSTTRACQAYCHSSAGPWNGTAYAAPTFASPTWGGTAPSCTGCHGGAGAATTMSGPHAKHVNSNAAGGYGFACSKCHYGTTQDGTTILASSTLHVNGTKTDVVFNTADPFTPAGSTWGGGATATTHTCASTYCHGNMTGGINATPSWTPGTLACTACHGVPPSNHAPGDTDCNSCHPGYSSTAVIVATHVNGTVDGGGGCTSCHNSVKDDAASPGSARRAVMTDFSRPSHHAGNGDAKRGGTLTDNDCAVCHAEAAVPSAQGGKIATGPLHKNGMVDLRDADNNANYFQYDKRALCVAAGGTTTTCDTAATAAAPTPWGATVAQAFHSGTAKFRQETSGRTDDAVGTANVACTADYSGVAQGAGCSKGLDRFCLSCHDANGASAAYVAGDAGATAGNPFKDTSITNEYDQLARPSRTGAPDAAGSVVDIASKIAGALTNGQYSRHAVRGQSTSRYLSYSTGRTIYNRGGTVTDGSGFVQRGTDASARPNWNDQSVMSCSDCHAVDGANGTNGNGHGATSEYMLKDGSGGATEGTLASLTYVCYRCHPSTRYNDTATHTGNSGDWIDSTAAAGSARVSGVKGNWQAMACGNCHGAMLSDTAPDFGGIHGTSSTFTNGAGGTRQAYRFTNGASLRFYDPGVWDTTAQNCYTLSTADTYGGCTQHGRNAGTKSKLFTRPLNY